MQSAPHDGRYAPSPTGPLHLGNLRTALVAWLCARSEGARILLRIDDLDPDRSRREHERTQLEDLARLGLDFDGEPVRQTDRLARYDEALRELERDELVFPCFCTRADIRAAAGAPHGIDGAYPGTCAQLTTSEAARRIAQGDEHCLRVRAGDVELEYEDGLLGTVHATVDAFVVRRRDGVPAYNLATTLDDADLGVGEVVRGADLATTATRQLWLAEALTVPVPSFTHVPLVLGPDGARLAKRHGAASLTELAALGIDAASVLRMLAESIGIDAPAARGAGDLIDAFDRAKLPREDVRIDPLRLAPGGGRWDDLTQSG